jgi:predicted transcriptional regulator
MYIRQSSINNQVAIPKEYLQLVAGDSRPIFEVTCNKNRRSVTLTLQGAPTEPETLQHIEETNKMTKKKIEPDRDLFKLGVPCLVLIELAKKPGQRPTDLSRILNVTFSHISHVVSELEAMGHVESEIIGRNKLIYISGTGRDISEAAQGLGRYSKC